MNIWHRRGFLTATYQGGEEKIWTERRQEKKQKPGSKNDHRGAGRQLKYDAPAIERLGIPTYNWWNEALHGVARAGTATVFPQAIGCAAMFDEEGMEKSLM